jgi:T-complex protein 1 subunit delta
VLLIQKSIIRDAVNDLALHFLARMKILAVTNIERDDIEFISKARLLSLSSHLPPPSLSVL